MPRVSRSASLVVALVGALASTAALGREKSPAPSSGVGSRVFVVERSSGQLAVYDYLAKRLLPERLKGLGDLHHAIMTFSQDLRFGYVASRAGLLSRIDLASLKVTGQVQTSKNSIDLAISQDGRYLAVAEYIPGGVTILDAATLKVLKRLSATGVRRGQTVTSRVTGMVDAPGNRFVCVLMEGAQIWVIDASRPDFPIERKVPTSTDLPYDAMITADGRYYMVAHIGSEHVSVLDLTKPQAGVKEISLRDPAQKFDKGSPMKLPHMASWAVAGPHVFVPLVGEKRLVVLTRDTWRFVRSIPLRGHPVYAVRSPTEREIWVSFSGKGDDAWLQVIDTEQLAVTRSLRVGRRVYHLDFTPRGAYVLVTANEDHKLVVVNATRYAIEDQQTLASPSGIFGVWRAFRIGL